jgi:hypothetical protein
LEVEGVADRVLLLERSHEDLGGVLSSPVSAAVFNLGYLPGVKDGRPTTPATTLAGLEAVRKLLAPGGLLLVCIYTGHEGGEVEAEVVEGWGGGLPPKEYNVWRCCQLNRSATAPYLLLVEKNPSSGSR